MALRKAPSAPASAIPCSRWGLTRRLFAPRKPLIFLPDCLPCGFLAECGPKGVQGGERKATLLASIDDNFAVSNSPWAGIDAPTPAREQGLQPYGALTLFFRWRKKSVQKKASGTATPGKSPLLPIFERGSSQCRAQHSWTANMDVRARSCSLFSSLQKGQGFFPPLPIAALLPHSWRWAGLSLAGWDASVWLGNFCGADE